MPEDKDDTVGYFKGLAGKTEPLRSGFKPVPDEKVSAPKPEAKKPLVIDDDDYKYMNKQAQKIGERLSKAASKKYSIKQSSKR